MLLLSATLAALTAASIYPVDVVLTTPKLEMLSEGPMYSNADAPLGADTSQITVILDMIPVVPVRPGESSSCTLLATRLPPHARRCHCRLSLLVLLRAPLSSPLALPRAHCAGPNARNRCPVHYKHQVRDRAAGRSTRMHSDGGVGLHDSDVCVACRGVPRQRAARAHAH